MELVHVEFDNIGLENSASKLLPQKWAMQWDVSGAALAPLNFKKGGGNKGKLVDFYLWPGL